MTTHHGNSINALATGLRVVLKDVPKDKRTTVAAMIDRLLFTGALVTNLEIRHEQLHDAATKALAMWSTYAPRNCVERDRLVELREALRGDQLACETTHEQTRADAVERAAQLWCDPLVSDRTMDVTFASVIARSFAELMDEVDRLRAASEDDGQERT